MDVSIKGHNEEALTRPVDKKKLVDMLENTSKIRQKLDNEQLPKDFSRGHREQAAIAPL